MEVPKEVTVGDHLAPIIMEDMEVDMGVDMGVDMEGMEGIDIPLTAGIEKNLLADLLIAGILLTIMTGDQIGLLIMTEGQDHLLIEAVLQNRMEKFWKNIL